MIRSILVDPKEIIPEECVRLNGITNHLTGNFGVNISSAIAELNYMAIKGNPKYLMAHNANGYDKLLLQSEIDRHKILAPNIASLEWIDTKTDLPFNDPPRSLHLSHLAMDAGFINPFPHRAVTDVLTMLRVASQFTLEEIEEYRSIPSVTIRAVVSYDQRDLAKQLRFSWQKDIGCWVKPVKVNQVELEKERGRKIGVEVVCI